MEKLDRSDPELGPTRRQIARTVRNERPRAYIVTDIGSPIVVTLLWLLLPFEISTTGRIGGALVLALVAPLDRLCRWKVSGAWSNYSVLVLRVVVAAALAWAAPIMWAPAAVVITTSTIGSVPVESRPRILSLVGIATIGMTLGALVNGLSYWYLTVVILVVCAVSTDAWYREWRIEREEVDRRHDDMIDRARILSWEIHTESGRVLSLVGNVEAILGYEPAELIGQPISKVIDASQRHAAAATMDPGGVERTAIVKARHRDGREVTLREVRLDSGDASIARGISVDISELAEANEKLRYQAEHDALTGLVNRSVLEASLRANLEEEGTPVGLILADLDRFKEINDTLGHPTGDRLLRVLAARFEGSLSDLDVVARVGGDEFAFVLLGDVTEEAVLAAAQRVHELATAPVEVDGLQLGVACSVGVAVSPTHGENYADLLKHADIATYQAKRTGGGVQLYESTPGALSVQRLRLVSELAGAITRGEIELHMQPQVDLITGEMVGAEGLARWRHPEYGLLPPAAFLHTIEVAADYDRFTNEVLRQAADFAALARQHGRDFNVAVNLGSMSFLDQSLPARLEALLAEHGLVGSAMTLEVTESDLLDEHGADAPVFDALKALGARLSIDDFGTGYSTLTRLRALDVDEVKIDRGFVMGLGAVAEDSIIVRAIVQLCRLLGHSVVAEGVETVEQMRLLQRFGCTLAQGYYFARPMPQQDLLAMIEAGTVFDVGSPERAANSPAPGLDVVVGMAVPEGLEERDRDPLLGQALDEVYDRVAESNPEGWVLVKDLAGRLIDANRVFRSVVGESRYRELLGRRDDDFATDPDVSRYEDADFVIDGFEPAAGEQTARLELKAGSELSMQTTRSALFDGVGRELGSVYIANVAPVRATS